MSKSTSLRALALMLPLLAVAACGGSDADAEDSNAATGRNSVAQVVWAMQSTPGPDHWWTQGQVTFAEEVERLSGGALTVEVNPSAGLGIPTTDTVTEVQSGSIPMGEFLTGYVAGTLPDFAVDSLPLLIPSHDASQEALDLLWSELDAFLQENYNQRILFAAPAEEQYLFASSPLATMEDLKGLVIRTTSPLQGEFLAKIDGASGVNMPYGEVYTALERGTIDGVITAPSAVPDSSFDEVVSHVFAMPINVPFLITTINLDAYNELDPSVQQAVDQAAEAAEKYWLEQGDKQAEETLEQLKEAGMVFHEPDDATAQQLREYAESVWASWAEQHPEKGAGWLDMLKGAGFPDGS